MHSVYVYEVRPRRDHRGFDLISDVPHSIIYSKNAEADRKFLRDVLKLTNVDVGHGWLIFGLPPAEVAVHPSEKNDVHEFYLMCRLTPEWQSGRCMQSSGISRNSAYAHRRRYPRFRKRWDRAQEAGWDGWWDARCRAWDAAHGDME